MGQPQTVEPIPLPAPTRGLNKKDPLAMMEDGYAAWMLNIEPEPQYLRLRNGVTLHCNVTGAARLSGLAAYGSTALFAYGDATGATNHSIWNVTTATSSSSTTTGGTAGPDDYCHSAYNAKSLYFLADSGYVGSTYSRYYDGSWHAYGFTEGGLDIATDVMVNYRGRAYLFLVTTLYYSTTITAKIGAMTAVDLGTIFDRAGSICWAELLTSPAQNSTEMMLAFGTTSGEVLVYAGDNPAATNWEIVGHFQLSPPVTVSGQCAYRFRNDILLMTQAGVVSIRALFQSGSGEVEQYNISRNIDPYWTLLVKSTTVAMGIADFTFASAAYWPEQNRIYFLLTGWVEPDGTSYDTSASTMFVYNTISRAWGVHKLPHAAHSIVYFNNALYYIVKFTAYVFKYNIAVYKDEISTALTTFQAIPYSVQSAYTNLGDGRKTKQIVGIEPILKTDFTGSAVTVKAAADFGRKVSAASSQTLLDGYNIPYYSVGVSGAYLQYRIEGSSDVASSDGLELYSVGLAVK